MSEYLFLFLFFFLGVKTKHLIGLLQSRAFYFFSVFFIKYRKNFFYFFLFLSSGLSLGGHKFIRVSDHFN